MAPKTKYKTGVLFLRDIPTELKNHFKSYCAKRGKSMKETVENFMRQCVGMDSKK